MFAGVPAYAQQAGGAVGADGAALVGAESRQPYDAAGGVAEGALALAVIGGGWYFKVYKPKHEDYDDDDEGMEYDDSDEESDD